MGRYLNDGPNRIECHVSGARMDVIRPVGALPLGTKGGSQRHRNQGVELLGQPCRQDR